MTISVLGPSHGHFAEVESGIAAIEATVVHDSGRPLSPVAESRAIEVRPAKFTGYLILLKLAFTSYWRRATSDPDGLSVVMLAADTLGASPPAKLFAREPGRHRPFGARVIPSGRAKTAKGSGHWCYRPANTRPAPGDHVGDALHHVCACEDLAGQRHHLLDGGPHISLACHGQAG